MKKILLIATALVFSFSFSKSFADGHGPEVYGPCLLYTSDAADE